MGIGRQIKRGLKHLERALDRPGFEWSGNAYPCTFASTTQAGRLTGGGLSPQDVGLLFVRREVLPDSIPALKDEITVRGKVFHVEQIDTLPGETVLKITYADPNRGA